MINQLKPNKPSIVPMGVTVGLGVFAWVLASLGYGFRLLAGEPLGVVLPHALIVVSFFVVGVPALFVLGAKCLNRYQNLTIHTQNAISLGLLISCVALLTIMGRYS